MSLLTLALLSAAIAGAAGVLATRRRARRAAEAEGPPPSPSDDGESTAIGELPLKLHDVVGTGDEERWLAGALVLRDGSSVQAGVFFAPEGGRHEVVVAFPPPRTEILWLRPVSVEVPDEPPTTLDIEGLAMRRRHRLPVTIERLGQGAARIGASGVIAEYVAGGRDVALLLQGTDDRCTFVGRRLDAGEYEVWGGGGRD